jgi:hypothetical protein
MRTLTLNNPIISIGSFKIHAVFCQHYAGPALLKTPWFSCGLL